MVLYTMENIEQFKTFCKELQIPFFIFLVESDQTINLCFANNSALSMLGYERIEDIPNISIDKLFNVESDEKIDICTIKSFLKLSSNSWVQTETTTKNGEKIFIGVNAIEYKDDEKRYIISTIRDRTESVKTREELIKAMEMTKAQKEEADAAKNEAVTARNEAVLAKGEVEEKLFVQKKLSAQVDLLRYIFKGIAGLIILLSSLVLVGWMTGKFEKDSLAMFERILLVLTGMLGTAMAGVFDSKRSQDQAK